MESRSAIKSSGQLQMPRLRLSLTCWNEHVHKSLLRPQIALSRPNVAGDIFQNLWCESFTQKIKKTCFKTPESFFKGKGWKVKSWQNGFQCSHGVTFLLFVFFSLRKIREWIECSILALNTSLKMPHVITPFYIRFNNIKKQWMIVPPSPRAYKKVLMWLLIHCNNAQEDELRRLMHK